MKRFLLLATAGLLALAASSCHKHEKPSQEEVMPTSYDTFTDAGAYYYGSLKDCNIFCAYLLTGQTRVDDGVISGIGTALYIDLNGVINDDNTIPVGTYGPARNDEETGVFLKGKWLDDDKISGTYIYYRSLNGSAEYRLVKNGEISFNFSGTSSSTKARIQATVVDEYGVEFTFDYEGWFSYDDMVEPDPGTDPDPDPEVEPVDYVLNDFIKGYIYDYGQDFGTDAVSDYRIWRICLADANFNLDDLSGSGQELQMEIITEADATDITGTFSVKYQDWPSTWSDALTKGSAFWGYIDNNNYVGTWFFPGTDEEKWTGATSGSVTITKGSSIYTITFDFADKFLQTTFKGTYKGGLTMKPVSKSKLSRKATATATSAMRSRTPDRAAVTATRIAR